MLRDVVHPVLNRYYKSVCSLKQYTKLTVEGNHGFFESDPEVAYLASNVVVAFNVPPPERKHVPYREEVDIHEVGISFMLKLLPAHFYRRFTRSRGSDCLLNLVQTYSRQATSE
jgi:hypothetical protein